jgi:hypothetical protein
VAAAPLPLHFKKPRREWILAAAGNADTSLGMTGLQTGGGVEGRTQVGTSSLSWPALRNVKEILARHLKNSGRACQRRLVRILSCASVSGWAIWNIWTNLADYHLNLWMHTLVELWS